MRQKNFEEVKECTVRSLWEISVPSFGHITIGEKQKGLLRATFLCFTGVSIDNLLIGAMTTSTLVTHRFLQTVKQKHMQMLSFIQYTHFFIFHISESLTRLWLSQNHNSDRHTICNFFIYMLKYYICKIQYWMNSMFRLLPNG